MSLRGFDAMGVFDGPQVRQAGGNFALRYVGIPGNPKCIQKPELLSLLSAGVAVGFVFESWAARATEGFDAGRADALAVENYMWRVLEIPSYPTVFYAVDADVSFDQVKEYFRGVNSVWKAGAYGSERVISGLLANNLVTEVWQTVAWSQGVVDQRASVYQTGEQGVLPNGTKYDVNTAPRLGGWAYPNGDDMSWTEELTFDDKAYQPEPETETAANWLMYGNKKTEQALGMLDVLISRPPAGTVQLSADDRTAIIQGVAEELRQDLLNGIQAMLNANKAQ